jgi:ubiquinone biosynthesis protein Coq4
MTLFLPYSGDQADPAMAARHEALGSLPMGTLGRGYWEIYKKNGYAFPGDPQDVNVAFARPHDSTHVMSGYDTTPQGEILVSTFTAGMHPKLPMKGHILPVIFSWHLGIELNKLAGSFKGALDPEQFWVAWVRGAQMKIDLFSPDWDFWAHVEEPIEQLRQRYHVLPRSEK